jgi:hypothetical protein
MVNPPDRSAGAGNLIAAISMRKSAKTFPCEGFGGNFV